MSKHHPRGPGALACLVAASVSVAVLSSGPAAAAAGPHPFIGLAAAAATSGRYFGSATDNPELTDVPYVQTLLSGEFSSLTVGNTMKWAYTEPTQGSFDFTQADQLVSLAHANRMQVRGHTLVWHNQLAGWVESLPTASVQAAMINHVTQEVKHFKGQVNSWDVVNEPFNEDGTLRDDVFSKAMGPDYIAKALRAARAADPKAKLYLNDYNIDGLGAKSDGMYALVAGLKKKGVPIDGVGFQAHLATQYGLPTGIRANLQRFADLGVDVAFTELDVRQTLPETATTRATQLAYYTNVVQSCVAVRRCVGITLWDYTDKHSWIPAVFPGEGAALPWDENIHKKPVLYAAIESALRGRPAN